MVDCYSERLDRALVWAASEFRGIRRKGTDIPYLTHLMQVSVWVGEYGGTEDQMIAALLHDIVEDMDHVSGEDVRTRFGKNVARMVVALSDAQSFPKPPWKERKEAYIARLRSEPADVKLVCACDKLHNTHCMVRDLQLEGPALWNRFTASADQIAWYLRGVYEALAVGWEHPVLQRLGAAVSELEGEIKKL